MPETAVVTDADELYRAHEQVAYPLFVKGVFYGATLGHGLEEALAAYYKVVAQWGVPGDPAGARGGRGAQRGRRRATARAGSWAPCR